MVYVKPFSLFVLSVGLLLTSSAVPAQSEPVVPFYKRAAAKISTFVKKHKWTIIKTAVAVTATAAVGYLFYRYRQEWIKNYDLEHDKKMLNDWLKYTRDAKEQAYTRIEALEKTGLESEKQTKEKIEALEKANLESEKQTKEYLERRNYAAQKKVQTDRAALQKLDEENNVVDQKAVRKEWKQLLSQEESKLRNAVLQTVVDQGLALSKKDAEVVLWKALEEQKPLWQADLHKASQLLETIGVTWLDICQDLAANDRERLLAAGIKDKYLDKIKVVDPDYLIKIKEQLKGKELPSELKYLFDFFISTNIAAYTICHRLITRVSKNVLGSVHETNVIFHEISHLKGKFSRLWTSILDKNCENCLNYCKFDEMAATIMGSLKSGLKSALFDFYNPFDTTNDGTHPIYAFEYETVFAVLKSRLTGQVPTEIPATWYS
jgi:hypothetical protein